MRESSRRFFGHHGICYRTFCRCVSVKEKRRLKRLCADRMRDSARRMLSISAPPGITLPDPNIADVHAWLSTTGAPRFAVRAEPKQTITFRDKPVESCSASVPMSFSIGPYSIDLRRERRRLATAELSRTLVFWQRPLRKDSKTVEYNKRKLVTPYVNNSSHYGSSDDPTPTDEQLAKLFE
jgi:hypothetical protein